MNKKPLIYLVLFSVLSMFYLESCDDLDGLRGIDVPIPEFDLPTSISFEQSLSAYNLFQGAPQNLQATTDYHLMELSSVLYTDYAEKQRLVKVPAGTQMTRNNDGSINFPDGTILAKTFYYFKDDRDTTLGKQIIETRLLIKEAGLWNVATYLWNEDQTDADLLLTGLDTPVNWITVNGINRSTTYHVPDKNECIACHQSNDKMIPLGTTLRNLNREVNRKNLSVNQIEHFQSLGLIDHFATNQISQIVDYKDASASMADRARAYLDMNCSHCHNPAAWRASAAADLDFSYETPFNRTGISQEKDRMERLMLNGEMPLIGTTLLDEEGVDVIIQYISGL